MVSTMAGSSDAAQVWGRKTQPAKNTPKSYFLACKAKLRLHQRITSTLRYLWSGTEVIRGKRKGLCPSNILRDQAVEEKVTVICDKMFFSGDVEDAKTGLNEWIEGEQGLQFAELRLATHSGILGHKENHYVSLLFDRKQQRAYVIDTKGAHPSKRFLLNNPADGSKSDLSVSSFVNAILGEHKKQKLENGDCTSGGYTVEHLSSKVQKANDCVPCAEAILRKLVSIEDLEKRSLQAAARSVHKDYEQVNEIREELKAGLTRLNFSEDEDKNELDADSGWVAISEDEDKNELDADSGLVAISDDEEDGIWEESIGQKRSLLQRIREWLAPKKDNDNDKDSDIIY